MARSTTIHLIRNLLICRDFAAMTSEQLNGARKYTVDYVCQVLSKRYYVSDRSIYLIATYNDQRSRQLLDIPSQMANDLMTLHARSDIDHLQADVEALVISFTWLGQAYERHYHNSELSDLIFTLNA